MYQITGTLPSYVCPQNPTMTDFSLGHPLSTFGPPSGSVPPGPCWFQGCFWGESPLEEKCPRQGGGQHPISLRKSGLPCPSLHPGSYIGACSPAQPGLWPDPPTHCALQPGAPFPPPPNPVALTSYPDGSGEHLDCRMTQGCEGFVSFPRLKKGPEGHHQKWSSVPRTRSI